jgi:hypothetical protein
MSGPEFATPTCLATSSKWYCSVELQAVILTELNGKYVRLLRSQLVSGPHDMTMYMFGSGTVQVPAGERFDQAFSAPET